MNYLSLRRRARELFPDYLPNARHNRSAWLRSVARLGAKWILLNPVPRMQQ